jgi:hypothetical protein
MASRKRIEFKSMKILRLLGLTSAAFVGGYVVGKATRPKALDRRGASMIHELAPQFAAVLPSLIGSLQHLTNRVVMTSTLADRVIFAFTQIAVEDFLEIVVLCKEGYGIGALKSLRSLYEHTVTLAYLSKNPAEAGRFLDYQPINEGKVLNQARALGQVDLFRLSPAKLEEIDNNYKEAKKSFQETVCKDCKTTRTQFSWSKLGVVEMARHADKFLYEMCAALYLLPTFHTHATVPAVVSRVKLGEHGGFKSNITAQPDHVPSALIGGHNLVLRLLDITNRHFAFGMDAEIERGLLGFQKAWPNPEQESS